MRFLIRTLNLLLFIFLVSCNQETFTSVQVGKVGKPSSFDLEVIDRSRILAVYKVGGVDRSYYVEDNTLIYDQHVPPHFKAALTLESYEFANNATKTDRYYYISNSDELNFTFDGISSSAIFAGPIFNSIFHNFVMKKGIFFHEDLERPSGQIGDAYYFSIKKGSAERVISRLGLVDGTIPVDHVSLIDNFNPNHCVDNPTSCSSVLFRWISKIVFLEDNERALGIASRLVEINGTDYILPAYTFRVSESSVQLLFKETRSEGGTLELQREREPGDKLFGVMKI